MMISLFKTPFTQPTSVVTLAVTCIALALASGCSKETGIVIEVTKGELGESPKALRFFVGVEAERIPVGVTGCDGATRYVDDSAAPGEAEERIDVSDRDLARDPYRLLLRPDDKLADGKGLKLAVVALSEANRVIGYGAVKEPVRFQDGKVLQWTIEPKRRPVEFDPNTANSCLCVGVDGSDPFVIALGADQDCDGDPAQTDCDDLNADIHHDATEVCGNQIDENCNDQLDEDEDRDGDTFTTCDGDCDDLDDQAFPEFEADEVCDGRDNGCDGERITDPALCYGRNGLGPNGCYIGMRICNDLDPTSGGWSEDCFPISNEPGFNASFELCDAYRDCGQDSGIGVERQFECATGSVFEIFDTCTLFVTSNGAGFDVCPQSGAIIDVDENLNECVWTVLGGVDQGGDFNTPASFKVSLNREVGQTTGNAVVMSCQPELEIVEVEPSAEQTVMFLWRFSPQEPNLHVMVEIADIVEVKQCPEQGLECLGLPDTTP